MRMSWPAIAILVGSAAQALTAQGLAGRVSDAVTGQPIVSASVLLADTSGRQLSAGTRTNPEGRFRLRASRSGTYRVIVMRLGYESKTSMSLVVGEGEDVSIDFGLRPISATLPEVRTSATVLIERFELQRTLGLGRTFTRTEIEEQGFADVLDVFREIPSARVRRSFQHDSTRVLLRAGQAADCEPTYYLNGMRLASATLRNNVNPAAKELVFNLPISLVQGIEVYSGPAQVPAVYGGSDAGCGVIVVWTITPR